MSTTSFLLSFSFLLLFSITTTAQNKLSDYLPNTVTYDQTITTPFDFFGFEIGDKHLSHDQIYYYLKHLAQTSNRISLEEYGKSHEKRPLVLLKITNKENQQNLEGIRKTHLNKIFTKEKTKAESPLIVWLGYTVHGNEASGSNAAVLMAYYLAAAQGETIEQILSETVVLLDPCMNPDGYQRFATWTNRYQSTTTNPDRQNIDFREPWPSGRTNHYLFDLNRDWAALSQVESQARIIPFHQWKPHVLTDVHEMDTDATYFFQPGVASRTNPNTPEENQTLTLDLAKYHAAALDSIGTSYFSGERFDDFFIGKGSTYPDLNGCIGILFEQASARGAAHEGENGVVHFPFAIRNQFNTSLSTLNGAFALKEELKQHQIDFYETALILAQKETTKALRFDYKEDKTKAIRLSNLLIAHDIQVFTDSLDESFVVPLQQNQYRLIKSIFEERTVFKDSIFYDVSAWTFPLAFNLTIKEEKNLTFSNLTPITQPILPKGELIVLSEKPVAFLFSVKDFYSYKLIHQLQIAGFTPKVSTKNFTLSKIDFPTGTIQISARKDREKIRAIIEQHLAQHQGTIYEVGTGLSSKGIDLGSAAFKNVDLPKIGLIVGSGVTAYEVGEAWHLLDHTMGIPTTLLPLSNMSGNDWSKYNVLILVNGSFNQLSQSKLQEWLSNGGTLITFKQASRWIASTNLCALRAKSLKNAVEVGARLPYDSHQEDRGAQVIGGSIFETKADLSHPLLFGYTSQTIPIFRNHRYFFELTKNPYATPLIYTEQPLLSGYVSDENLALLKNTSALSCAAYNKGRIIAFTDNPIFRGFWYGTTPLFLNAVFFGNIIEGRTTE